MKHLDVAAGILVYGDRVLCLKRGVHKYEYLSFRYEFPGGKIEAGESGAEALMRELSEELEISLTVSEQDLYQSVSHMYPDFEVTLYFYLCRVSSDEFVMKEHAGFAWLRREELMDVSWMPADYPVIERLVKEGF